MNPGEYIKTRAKFVMKNTIALLSLDASQILLGILVYDSIVFCM